jgi:hypothetical protein
MYICKWYLENGVAIGAAPNDGHFAECLCRRK